EPRLIGKILQSWPQELRTSIKRLRNYLLASGGVSYHELDVALPGHRRDVGDGERARLDRLLAYPVSIHEDVYYGGQRSHAARRLQGERDEAWARSEVGAVLNAPKTDRSTPFTCSRDAVA